jgi:paraquat-inducible protein B
MKRLIELETLIARSQESFCQIGRALKEIKDGRLYKQALFETFEAYAKARWDIGRSQAYRLIKSYEVVRNLSPIGDIMPANESQVRPLAQLDPCEQRNIWKDFIKSGVELTAQNIRKFIDSQRSKQQIRSDLSDRITDEYMAAVNAMFEQVRVAQHDHWQKTSQQAALLWNRVLREKILSQGIVRQLPWPVTTINLSG